MVRVDDVYQKVLAIANKEQRGYVTPQEFNLFADHAQMEIFEQYFYDLSQHKRRVASNKTSDKDPVEIIQQKLINFKKGVDISWTYDLSNIPDFYRIESVTAYNYEPHNKEPYIYIEEVDRGDMFSINNFSAPLLRPTKKRLFYFTQDNNIQIIRPPLEIQPPSANILGTNMMNGWVPHLFYIKKPLKPNWTYIISNQSALYNSNANDHQDFELHASEENKLVIAILKLLGINVKDFNLTQAAAQEEIKTIQQQKQ